LVFFLIIIFFFFYYFWIFKNKNQLISNNQIKKEIQIKEDDHQKEKDDQEEENGELKTKIILSKNYQHHLDKRQFHFFKFSKKIPTGLYVKKEDKLKIKYLTKWEEIFHKPILVIFYINFNEHDKNNYPKEIKIRLNNKEQEIIADEKGIVFFDDYYAIIDNKSSIAIEIIGGRKIPQFILGKTNENDWLTILNKYSSSPYIELVSERNLINVSFEQGKKMINKPHSLLELLDKIVNIIEELYGLNSKNLFPHNNIKNKIHHIESIKFLNINRSTAEAGNFFIIYKKKRILNELLDFEKLKCGRTIWHEIGHLYSPRPFIWNINLMREAFAELSAAFVQVKLNEIKNESFKMWIDIERFFKNQYIDSYIEIYQIRAVMLWQLILSFGEDFFARLATDYRNNYQEINKIIDESKNHDNRVKYIEDNFLDIFVLKASNISQYDLLPFFKKWKIKVDESTTRKINALKLKKLNKGCLENESTPVWEKKDFIDLFINPYENCTFGSTKIL
jgi:hypothetical protein